MNSQAQQMIQSVGTLLEAVQVLKPALASQDGDQAHEAVSVMLLEGMELFGPESVAMQQFFPVMDTIKRRIDGADFPGALRQANLFEEQLKELQDLLRNS